MTGLALSLDSVAQVLMGFRRDLRGMGIGESDVRLCVWAGGQWDVKTGDVSYDTEHSDYCGAGTMRASDRTAEIYDLARDLMGQVADQANEAP